MEKEIEKEKAKRKKRNAYSITLCFRIEQCWNLNALNKMLDFLCSYKIKK